VVHMSSGWSALILCIILGKRLGFGKEPMPPHNMVLCMVGTGMLWVGWYGFNAGSAVAADGIAANAFTTTTIATAVASFVWAMAEYAFKGKPSVLGAASGMVAGLATITPASGFVTIPAAVVIGLVAGVVCYTAVTKLKSHFGYDDSLDVFGVHGIGSVVGMLMLGFLASAEVNTAIAGTFQSGGHAVSLAGGGAQFVNQLKAVLFTMVFSGVASLVILKAVDKLIGLRVDIEDESLGLDLSQHGERAYNE